ncbi:hypothetical protein VTK56DRAFT_9247 [Thermocarpiscus australiensis]
MLRRTLTRSLKPTAIRPLPRLSPYSTAGKVSDPLRILFCGSDEFSCVSLRALHEEHKRNADLIRSIDVVVRPSKPTGRGLKVLREVPLRTLADQLRLPVHVRDTFTGWHMPQPNGDPINLIIAVSFGLFVPPRLLNASKYGGLNVHPSLLPDLRGPAPLHHALLAERTHTGVTIQTLSPETFDAGTILLQTPAPGIPIPPGCTVSQLHDLLAPAGAAMLVEALRAGLHVPPYPSQKTQAQAHQTASDETEKNRGRESLPLRHAPKITPHDRQVLWTRAGAREVALRARVLGRLWTHMAIAADPGKKPASAGGGPEKTGRTHTHKRVILEDVSEAAAAATAGFTGVQVQGEEEGRQERSVQWVQKAGLKDNEGGLASREELVTVECRVDGDGEAVLMRMADGSWLRIGRIRVEGLTSKPARAVLESQWSG